MPKPSLADKLTVSFLRAHSRVYIATGGRIGHVIPGGAPKSLILGHRGAKTGAARLTVLSYFADGEFAGDRVFVVASAGGARRHPAWFHNLRAAAAKGAPVTISRGTQRNAATATVLTPEDSDYARLWTQANAENAGRYDVYQSKTTRPIPIVLLTVTAG